MKIGKIFQSCLLINAIVAISLFSSGKAYSKVKASVKEWDIPMLSVMTGPVAFAGAPAFWGAEYAAKEINKAGGVNGVPIKITVYDTAFNTSKAVSWMNKAVENSLIILGPMDGPGADAAGSVAFESKVAFIAALSFPEARVRMKPYGLACMQDSPAGSVMAVTEWKKLYPNLNSLVIFYMPSDPAQAEEFKQMSDMMQKLKIKLAGTVELQTGQLDMGAAVVKAMNMKPDGFFCIMRTDEYAKIATELFNRGVTDGRRICTTFAAMSPSLTSLAKGKLNNSYMWDKMDMDYPSATWKAVVEAYKADHSGQPPAIGTIIYFYDAVYAIKAAFEENNITGDKSKLAEERTKIANYLFNSKPIVGLQGKFQWVNGKKDAPYYFFQFKDDKRVRVGGTLK